MATRGRPKTHRTIEIKGVGYSRRSGRHFVALRLQDVNEPDRPTEALMSWQQAETVLTSLTKAIKKTKQFDLEDEEDDE